MEELFRSGTLEMSASPLSGFVPGPAWEDLPGNRILAVLAIVLLILALPDIFRIAPHLGYAFSRSHGAADLEHSLGTARTRNTVALLLLLPFCLAADRYALARPDFRSGIPDAWSPALTLGLFAAYLLLRRLCHLLFRPRRLSAEQCAALQHNPANYFIPLTALMLLGSGILALFGASDALIRSVSYWEIAALMLFALFRSGQILGAHCTGFATIMYLCGLEIVPAAVLVAVIVFF